MTFILELPVDLGLPEDSGLAILTDDRVLTGWTSRELVEFIRAPHDVPEGDRVPEVSLSFRRARVNVGMPTESTDRTFKHLDEEFLTRGQRWHRRLRLWRLSRTGAEVWKTVVAVSRFHDVTAPLPETADEMQEWLLDHFHVALPRLNDFLTSLGCVTGDAQFGALAVTDLPAGVPVIVRAALGPESPPTVRTMWLMLHHEIPDLVGRQTAPSVAEGAGFLWMEQHFGDEPLFPFFASFHEAQRAVAAGHHAQGLVALSNSIELLVRTLDACWTEP